MINKQNTTRYAPAGSWRILPGCRNRVFDNRQRANERRPDAGDEGVPAIWAQCARGAAPPPGRCTFRHLDCAPRTRRRSERRNPARRAGELECDRVEPQFRRDIQHAWAQADRRGRTVRIEARDRIEPEVLALAAACVRAAPQGGSSQRPRRCRAPRSIRTPRASRRSRISWSAIPTALPLVSRAVSPWARASRPTSSPSSARTASARRTCSGNRGRAEAQRAAMAACST